MNMEKEQSRVLWIFLVGWCCFLAMIPLTLAKILYPNLPNPDSTKLPKSNPWNWPWR
uniref:ATP synthase F0 subunit 8 n=1 Tax=Physiculus nematopus TaxID=2048758 RepID=UPI0028D61729|nr:ATP synthase F0 subunit 8 [Physiculus nematopus]WMY89620.1 ATP synthase F0 subunit 8 [Physiculus nematopus]